MDTDPPKYPPLTQDALVNYNHLNPFSEVVPAEKMGELELQLLHLKAEHQRAINELNAQLSQWEDQHCNRE